MEMHESLQERRAPPVLVEGWDGFKRDRERRNEAAHRYTSTDLMRTRFEVRLRPRMPSLFIDATRAKRCKVRKFMLMG